MNLSKIFRFGTRTLVSAAAPDLITLLNTTAPRMIWDTGMTRAAPVCARWEHHITVHWSSSLLRSSVPRGRSWRWVSVSVEETQCPSARCLLSTVWPVSALTRPSWPHTWVSWPLLWSPSLSWSLSISWQPRRDPTETSDTRGDPRYENCRLSIQDDLSCCRSDSTISGLSPHQAAYSITINQSQQRSPSPITSASSTPLCFDDKTRL